MDPKTLDLTRNFFHVTLIGYHRTLTNPNGTMYLGSWRTSTVRTRGHSGTTMIAATQERGDNASLT